MQAKRAIVVAATLICTLAIASPVVAGDAPVKGSKAIDDPCLELPAEADGTHRQTFDNVEVTNQIAGTPPRIETQLGRGDSNSYCVGFQNRTGAPMSLDIEISDVGVDADGRPLVGVDDAEFGAASWITPSAKRIVDLPHGTMAWIELDAEVPDDAVVGSSYASVTAVQAKEDADSVGSGNVKVAPISSVALQIFFDVAGDADIDGEIVDIRSPRVIWWDGFDIGDLPVLDDLRGLGVASIRYGWRNDGNLTSSVKGRVSIDSDLGGKNVARLETPERVVLRGATRSFETTWSEDIPFIGRFTPTVEVTDALGDVHKREADPIWVIPSWWYLLALFMAIAIPVWIRRRNKRQYRELLARVEAAEARDDEDDDSDSDGDWA